MCTTHNIKRPSGSSLLFCEATDGPGQTTRMKLCADSFDTHFSSHCWCVLGNGIPQLVWELCGKELPSCTQLHVQKCEQISRYEISRENSLTQALKFPWILLQNVASIAPLLRALEALLSGIFEDLHTATQWILNSEMCVGPSCQKLSVSVFCLLWFDSDYNNYMYIGRNRYQL